MTTPPDLITDPPVQIVITRDTESGGFAIINMSMHKTLSRTTAPTREHALAAVADYMQFLLLPDRDP